MGLRFAIWAAARPGCVRLDVRVVEVLVGEHPTVWTLLIGVVRLLCSRAYTDSWEVDGEVEVAGGAATYEGGAITVAVPCLSVVCTT